MLGALSRIVAARGRNVFIVAGSDHYLLVLAPSCCPPELTGYTHPTVLPDSPLHVGAKDSQR